MTIRPCQQVNHDDLEVLFENLEGGAPLSARWARAYPT